MPFRKFPARYAGIIMPLLLSLLMTCIVSAVSVLHAEGFTARFFTVWPGAWVLSWLIAFPVLLLVLPLVRRLVRLLVAEA